MALNNRSLARVMTRFNRLFVQPSKFKEDTADYGVYPATQLVVVKMPPGQSVNPIELHDYQANVLFSVDQTGVVSSAGGVTNPADNSLALAKLVRGTNGQIPLGQTGAATAYETMSGDATIAANGALTIGAAKVTKAKSAAFYAGAQTGNAGAQAIAHGLGADPAIVLVVPTDGGTATYTHDATNVTVTCSTGKKYDVLAWA